VLKLFVVTTCKWSINPVSNPESLLLVTICITEVPNHVYQFEDTFKGSAFWELQSGRKLIVVPIIALSWQFRNSTGREWRQHCQLQHHCPTEACWSVVLPVVRFSSEHYSTTTVSLAALTSLGNYRWNKYLTRALHSSILVLSHTQAGPVIITLRHGPTATGLQTSVERDGPTTRLLVPVMLSFLPRVVSSRLQTYTTIFTNSTDQGLSWESNNSR
jgi:hypothetical protein